MLQVGEMSMKALVLQRLFIQLRSKRGAFWVFMTLSCVALCENLAELTFSRPLSNCLIALQVFYFFSGVKRIQRTKFDTVVTSLLLTLRNEYCSQ
jgi:hypothetical protein